MASAQTPPEVPGVDPNSFANHDHYRVSHMDIDVVVDFKASSLTGTVTHTVVRGDSWTEAAPSVLVLDSAASMTISGVSCGCGPKGSLDFVLGKEHTVLGRALMITLNENCLKELESGQCKVVVAFSTGATATALQWMPASATGSGKYPFLFTQCQAIHCRSMLPCQDAPAVKATYTAALTVDAPLMALASAVRQGEPQEVDGGRVKYNYAMENPIPSYLIALCVGELEGRRVGPRSTVYAEPGMVEACAKEFDGTEKFVAAAESLVGPYVWGEYNLLVLPAAFPYGGMENPVCTFVTPTLIAGDKSLTNVVIHEIAHSWTGNLVTNKDWTDFWLNEGFTMFLQRHVEALIDGESAFHIGAVIGLKGLKSDIERYGVDHGFTALVPDIRGQDPDDSFSRVPYEKGFNFLYYLQETAGGKDAFLPFFKSWIQDNAFKSVTTAMFQEAYTKTFPEASAKVDWEKWTKAPGHVPVEPAFDATETSAVISAAEAIAAGGAPGPIPEHWKTSHKLVFLDALSDAKTKMTVEAVTALNEVQKWEDQCGNSEIRFRWDSLRLSAGDAGVFPDVVAFVKECGRMKFTRPLYRSLAAFSDEGAALAKSTFTGCKASYHPITAKVVAKDLGL